MVVRRLNPAIEYTSGSKFWYKNGLLHREGGPAIESLLSKINVNSELESLKEQSKHITNKTQLNKVHKKLRYLQALKDKKMQPTDYMIKNVLVVPSTMDAA